MCVTDGLASSSWIPRTFQGGLLTWGFLWTPSLVLTLQCLLLRNQVIPVGNVTVAASLFPFLPQPPLFLMEVITKAVLPWKQPECKHFKCSPDFATGTPHPLLLGMQDGGTTLEKSEFLMKINMSGFPGGAVVKNLPANAGDMGLSPGPWRSHMLQSN